MSNTTEKTGLAVVSAIRTDKNEQIALRERLRRAEALRGAYSPQVGDIAISIPGIWAGQRTTGQELLIVEVHETPLLNAQWQPGQMPVFKEFDITVAVEDGDGDIIYYHLNSALLQLVERPVP